MKSIKPFLILQLRPEDEASDNELDAFLKFGGLTPENVRRIRIEKESIGAIHLEDYSGVLVGGGPSNVSDDETKKPDNQKRFENELKGLLTKITEKDFPFLGGCYGIGILASFLGAKISKERYSEDVGAVEIVLSEDGQQDKLAKGVANQFKAFAGHKEACQNLPENVVLLAGNSDCPIQMVRYKNNIYATQFHTELDQQGLELRINTYRHAGYFPPEGAEMLIAESKHEVITEPEKILKNFINIYAKPA